MQRSKSEPKPNKKSNSPPLVPDFHAPATFIDLTEEPQRHLFDMYMDGLSNDVAPDEKLSSVGYKVLKNMPCSWAFPTFDVDQTALDYNEEDTGNVLSYHVGYIRVLETLLTDHADKLCVQLARGQTPNMVNELRHMEKEVRNLQKKANGWRGELAMLVEGLGSE
ncbi:MAG: hypothetical protein Q9201_000416 [Fulgogasparrea decipioides]